MVLRDAAARQRMLIPAACILLSGLLQLGGPVTADWLRYDRAHTLAGEFWRLLSAHLIHLGWRHWAFNAAALAMVFALYGRELSPGTFLWWALISALSVGLGLLLCAPSVSWYLGLSGVLHGLVVAGAVTELRPHPAGSIAVLALLTLKLAWEQRWGPLPGSESLVGGSVVVDAHLFGALGGLVATVLRPRIPARSPSPRQ